MKQKRCAGERFGKLGNVSRETEDRLREYHDLLLRWTKRINLIASSTRDEVWTRHISDSMQLWEHVPVDAETWVDLGTGGGMPGLVVAILAARERPQLRFTLIDSDRRKAAFLQHAVAQLGLNAAVLPIRVEAARVEPQDVVSARALASLERLLELSQPLVHEGSIMLFPKGRAALSELTEAERSWHISYEIVPSRFEGGGTIIKIFGVESR